MPDSTTDSTAAGPLAGIRVLEFSQIVAAPVCGVHLSDFGADVVKVEPPGGEQTRGMGAVAPGNSKGFQALNRGKRSLVVELHDPRGRELIRRLVPRTDVILTNYRLGVAERMGIDYETLRAIRPDLIYWQNTGFGERGPESTRAGSDVVAQAYSGLMVTDGKVDEDGAPDLISIPIADIMSGFGAAMAIGMALYHRERTGEGQYLSTSLLRTSLFMQGATVMREPVTDSVLRDPMLAAVHQARDAGQSYDGMLEARRRHQGARAAFRLYYGGYRAKDGAVVLGALTKANRAGIRRVLGIPTEGPDAERSDQPDYNALDPESLASAQRWKAEIRRRFLQRTVAEWVAALDAEGIPVSPVQLPEEMSEDPQVVADGMMVDLEHTVTGPLRAVGPATLMSVTPTAARRPAPALGEHSREVLLEAGLASDEVDALCRDGVVVQG